ncbi:NUDIX hydrolase [Rhodococcus sp. UNC23MFCrub1.1]|jgi:8-oxo-dGTP pyrophosphatase MutT (NUDIX family)|uniref:NUDIX hydrolase n=1 Tax=Rhodococcus sp. UNC23MFCrub1.1 TaxID=1449068 RepID=UPI000480F7C6|nr:NUDIX domain-containing protein [Rhodococcus sp. UNC23MFCrub1.1]
MPDDEIVAVYDERGHVVGAAPRTEVYERGLWHASAGVLVRSTDGSRVYVHRRTTTKSVFAGMHDVLAGGVVDAGEDPRQTASRELAEELGVVADVTGDPVVGRWTGRSGAATVRCHLFAYEVRHDGPMHHQPSEIADGWWWSDVEVLTHLDDPAWPFVPDTRVIVSALLQVGGQRY